MIEYSVDDSRMLPMKSSAAAALPTMVLSKSWVDMMGCAIFQCTSRNRTSRSMSGTPLYLMDTALYEPLEGNRATL